MTEIRVKVAPVWKGDYDENIVYDISDEVSFTSDMVEEITENTPTFGHYRSLKKNNDSPLTDNSSWDLILDLSRIENVTKEGEEFNRTFNENEAVRVNNENNRINQENTRNSNEQTRINNENNRKSSETGRKDAETNRVNSENSRKDNENARINAENTRKNAENTRNSNEDTRISNENARQTNENSRATAETTRRTNENNRVAAENTRQTNEETRQQQEGSSTDAPNPTGSRWARYKQAESDRTTLFNQTQNTRQDSYNQAEGTPSDTASSNGSRWARFKKAEEDRDALVNEKVGDITRLQEEKADTEALENGDIIPAYAEDLAPWADQKALVEDTYTDEVRTSGGDIPLMTSYGVKPKSIVPVPTKKWTADMLFNGSYNMLNAAKFGSESNQPYVGDIYSDFVYFLVPELTLGTFGTAEENNGLLFTDSNNENVQPTSVRFKPNGSSLPSSLNDGDLLTPTSVTYDDKTYKVYETSNPGWIIIPRTYYDNDICAHIAWEDWYNKYVSLDEPDTNPEAQVGALILSSFLTLVAIDGYLRGINDEVNDHVMFEDTKVVGYHMVDETSVATNAWTNAATGETDSQGNSLYRHSTTISSMKQGGVACIKEGVELNVSGNTVSYVDTNATVASACTVFYQIPTTTTVERSYDDITFSDSTIDFETGKMPINDCSIEAQVGAVGEAYITNEYAKNIADQVAINATVDVPQIKEQVEEHEERITELEDTAVRTGSYDASVAVGLADNFKGDTIVEAEFYKRKTGGTQSVGSGIAAIKEVRGKSIVWNQTVENGNFASASGWGKMGGTISVSDNKLSFVYDGTSSTAGVYKNIPSFVKEHKYYVHYFILNTTSSLPAFGAGGSYASGITRINSVESTPNVLSKAAAIVSLASNSNATTLLWRYKNNITLANCVLVDLTLMFGAGNEPATVAEFEKMFPLDYYDYNEGTIIPFAGQNLVTIGKNQYNPTSGKANLLGGKQYQIKGTYTKIYPSVASFVDYTYGSPVTSGTYYVNDGNHYVSNINVAAYDNTKTYVLGSYCINNDTVYKSNVAIETAEEFDSTKWDVIADVASMVTEGIFTLLDITPDANGLFTLTKDTEVTVIGGNDEDTFVGFYDGEDNTFVPYEKHTLPLDPSQWRDKQGNLVFPYGGMHGVGTAYDYAKVDADGYIRRAVRVLEQIDMGNLTGWSTAGGNKIPFVYTRVPNGKTASVNFIASTLAHVGIGQTNNNVGVGGSLGVNDQLRVRLDSDGTNLQNLRKRLQGVMLIYELAEPVEVELATPVYAKYLVDKDGTEEITPANGATPYTTPANLSILYAMDARGEIKNLPKNYLSKESAENMLNAMVSAGVIASYTMTWDSTNNRYAFVITAPVEPEPTPEPEETNEP